MDRAQDNTKGGRLCRHLQTAGRRIERVRLGHKPDKSIEALEDSWETAEFTVGATIAKGERSLSAICILRAVPMF